MRENWRQVASEIQPKLALGAGPATNRFRPALFLLCNLQGPVREAGSRTVTLLLISLCRPLCNEMLRNQRPTLVVPPNVSKSVKYICIGNVFLLETFLVNFLPSPGPFRRKDDFTINKFKHIRPCLCSLSCKETWQGDGHALTN